MQNRPGVALCTMATIIRDLGMGWLSVQYHRYLHASVDENECVSHEWDLPYVIRKNIVIFD